MSVARVSPCVTAFVGALVVANGAGHSDMVTSPPTHLRLTSMSMSGTLTPYLKFPAAPAQCRPLYAGTRALLFAVLDHSRGGCCRLSFIALLVVSLEAFLTHVWASCCVGNGVIEVGEGGGGVCGPALWRTS
jgi:hypothetical protein